MKKIVLAAMAVLLFVASGFLMFVGYGIYQFTQPIEVLALDTPWTSSVDLEAPLPAYPRPQLRRDNWQNLNGRWQYVVTPRDAAQPTDFQNEIIVPFAIESSLSGVQQTLLPEDRLWYRRSFEVTSVEPGQRLLLHFGAVDWEAEVWLNGERVGIHRGGYDPFTFDISELISTGGEQELVVGVWDPSNFGEGAYGKQHLVPHGIRYTAVSGIWQTVWLEAVPASRIKKVVGHTNLSAGEVNLQVETLGANAGDEIEAVVRAGDSIVAVVRAAVDDNGAVLPVAPEILHLWSPDDPFLYDVELRLLRNDVVVDVVESYFGAREVGIAEDEEGVTRLILNGEPVFHLGLLDQGWWPDGLYTAPTAEALAFDIEATRRMGFNTIRKHVKVEPARWYWHADRLGLLVWQDMPSGDGGANRYQQILLQAWDIFSASMDGKFQRELSRSPASAEYFREELSAMIDYLESFPSVVAWVPFNEAWGQFDTDNILAEVSRRDPSRLVDGPSGWLDFGTGDIRDLHVYDQELEFVDELPAGRALVYGEFGGLGLPLKNHLSVESGWGYTGFENAKAYEAAYVELLSLIESYVPRGLTGAIYTQTTDVESEINGLMTYDRRKFKISPERLAEINRRVIAQESR